VDRCSAQLSPLRCKYVLPARLFLRLNVTDAPEASLRAIEHRRGRTRLYSPLLPVLSLLSLPTRSVARRFHRPGPAFARSHPSRGWRRYGNGRVPERRGGPGSAPRARRSSSRPEPLPMSNDWPRPRCPSDRNGVHLASPRLVSVDADCPFDTTRRDRGVGCPRPWYTRSTGPNLLRNNGDTRRPTRRDREPRCRSSASSR
jgi:hypothetical protein